MSLIPWRNKRESSEGELSPLVALRSEMDRLFDSFLREPFGALDWPQWGAGKWSPAVDVAEDDKELTVRAELPGIDPKDLDVTVVGNQLVLSGEKKESSETKEKGSTTARPATARSAARCRCPRESTRSTSTPSTPTAC